jgi:hypothetical protein
MAERLATALLQGNLTEHSLILEGFRLAILNSQTYFHFGI